MAEAAFQPNPKRLGYRRRSIKNLNEAWRSVKDSFGPAPPRVPKIPNAHASSNGPTSLNGPASPKLPNGTTPPTLANGLTPPKIITATVVPDRTTSVAPDSSCLVQTTIGPVEGFVDTSFPNVKQWLGIPFAEPPVGDKRFAPPVAKKPLPEGEVLAATKMPPSPMQLNTSNADIYAKYVPEFLARGPYSEDCLYLNVFAPLKKSKAPLPTLVFFYYGQGEWGGINAEYLQPQAWVERSQKHIVVLFKCVLNEASVIFLDMLTCAV